MDNMDEVTYPVRIEPVSYTHLTERQELLGTAETGGLTEGAERPAGRDTGHDAQGQLRHLQL